MAPEHHQPGTHSGVNTRDVNMFTFITSMCHAEHTALNKCLDSDHNIEEYMAMSQQFWKCHDDVDNMIKCAEWVIRHPPKE